MRKGGRAVWLTLEILSKCARTARFVPPQSRSTSRKSRHAFTVSQQRQLFTRRSLVAARSEILNASSSLSKLWVGSMQIAFTSNPA